MDLRGTYYRRVQCVACMFITSSSAVVTMLVVPVAQVSKQNEKDLMCVCVCDCVNVCVCVLCKCVCVCKCVCFV